MKWLGALARRRKKRDGINPKRDDELFQRMESTIAGKGLYLQKNLSLILLAREVGTNRTYVSSILKARGWTFSSYIGSFRVQLLIKILSAPGGTGLDAGTVADMCGFTSERTMNYYLGCTMGLTFSQFRRRCLLLSRAETERNSP